MAFQDDLLSFLRSYQTVPLNAAQGAQVQAQRYQQDPLATMAQVLGAATAQKPAMRFGVNNLEEPSNWTGRVFTDPWGRASTSGLSGGF
jgi:hypothetical protein